MSQLMQKDKDYVITYGVVAHVCLAPYESPAGTLQIILVEKFRVTVSIG